MVTSAQAVLGIGVRFLAAVIFRMRLIRMAQALLARSTPLGQALSWQLVLLVCTRKHGLDLILAHYFFLMNLYIYSYRIPPSHHHFFFPHYPFKLFLPASVGQSCLYASVIQMCYSVFFFLPPRYVGILLTSITFLFFLHISKPALLFLFLSLILSVYVSGCLYKFFFAAHDTFCLLYLFFFSFLLSSFKLPLINNNDDNNDNKPPTQLVVQNNRNILYSFLFFLSLSPNALEL